MRREDDVGVLEEATILEIVLNNDVCHRIKHKLNICSIGGAGKVSVDLLEIPFLVTAPIEGLELKLNIRGCVLVSVWAVVFWEADGQCRVTYLFFK